MMLMYYIQHIKTLATWYDTQFDFFWRRRTILLNVHISKKKYVYVVLNITEDNYEYLNFFCYLY